MDTISYMLYVYAHNSYINKKDIHYPFQNDIIHYYIPDRTQVMIRYVTLYPYFKQLHFGVDDYFFSIIIRPFVILQFW